MDRGLGLNSGAMSGARSARQVVYHHTTPGTPGQTSKKESNSVFRDESLLLNHCRNPLSVDFVESPHGFAV